MTAPKGTASTDAVLVCVEWSPNLNRWYAQVLGSEDVYFGMTAAEAALALVVALLGADHIEVAVRDEWSRETKFLDPAAHREADVLSWGPRVRP